MEHGAMLGCYLYATHVHGGSMTNVTEQDTAKREDWRARGVRCDHMASIPRSIKSLYFLTKWLSLDWVLKSIPLTNFFSYYSW